MIYGYSTLPPRPGYCRRSTPNKKKLTRANGKENNTEWEHPTTAECLFNHFHPVSIACFGVQTFLSPSRCLREELFWHSRYVFLSLSSYVFYSSKAAQIDESSLVKYESQRLKHFGSIIGLAESIQTRSRSIEQISFRKQIPMGIMKSVSHLRQLSQV